MSHYNKEENMKSKRISTIYFIIGIFCFLSVQSKAQNKIEFDKLINDLGTFSEDSNPRICTFRFTNHQTEAIAIAHVQSTCGCAVPEYTKKAIQPGENGEIRITYNPQGRPGIFNRAILVSFSGQEKKVQLFVKGTVTPGAIRKDKSYPYVMGDLQLRTTGMKLKQMRSDIQQQSIMVVNSGNSPLSVSIESALSCISATLVPHILQPNQKGEIQITRSADENRNRTFCIRLKENAHQQNVTGNVSIVITSEKCAQ